MDSLIEIVASAVVVWQLRGDEGSDRERRALRIVAVAVAIVWLAVTVVAMLVLAAGKRDTGRRSS